MALCECCWAYRRAGFHRLISSQRVPAHSRWSAVSIFQCFRPLLRSHHLRNKIIRHFRYLPVWKCIGRDSGRRSFPPTAYQPWLTAKCAGGCQQLNQQQWFFPSMWPQNMSVYTLPCSGLENDMMTMTKWRTVFFPNFYVSYIYNFVLPSVYSFTSLRWRASFYPLPCFFFSLSVFVSSEVVSIRQMVRGMSTLFCKHRRNSLEETWRFP